MSEGPSKEEIKTALRLERIFASQYSRILTHEKDHAALKRYNSAVMQVNLNKGVCALPVFSGLAYAGALYKGPKYAPKIA